LLCHLDHIVAFGAEVSLFVPIRIAEWQLYRAPVFRAAIDQRRFGSTAMYQADVLTRRKVRRP
jgi:hypothetical protein